MVGIFFDFDGTLVDSIPIVLGGHQEIARRLGLVAPTLESYYRLIAPNYVDYYAQRTTVSREELDRIFYAYRDSHRGEVEFFPGVRETIVQLDAEGHLLILVTTNAEESTLPFLERGNLLGHFDHLEFAVLDKAACLSKLVEERGLSRNHCLYIGDSPSDIKAGCKVGLWTTAFCPHSYAEYTEEPLRAENPNFLIYDFRALPLLVMEIELKSEWAD